MKNELSKPHIGRLGPAVNLRAAGVMASANRKRDAKRERKAMRAALRRNDDAF